MPISLFACITETIAVLSVSAASSAAGATMPLASTGSSVVVQPRRASALNVLSTASCSMALAMRWRRPVDLERLGDAAEREVVGLGAAAREHDLGRLAPDQIRDRGPRVVEHALAR